MKRVHYLVLSMMLFIVVSCTSKTNYCNNPELDSALKKALILKMKNWQTNAKYVGINNFEKEINTIIENIEIVETSYIGANTNNETNSCRCSSIIRFKDHEKYKQKINGPVTKVRAEEHELNTPYLSLKKEMNYLDNDGFLFSYVVVKKDEHPIQVIPQYPFVLKPNIDNVGGLLFNYITNYQDKND